jgi:purine-binding chemotaxis protein CheW
MNAEPLYLIGAIAGRPVAIDSAPVDSVIEIAAVQSVPGASPAILGLAALRSRVLTLVDCAVALGLETKRDEKRTLPTIVLAIDGCLYGFVLDRVEDVVIANRPLTPASAPLGGAWSAVTAGIVEIAGVAMPVIEPAALLATLSARAA